MAIVKLAKNGFGQIELNQAAFRRDGRIEAQCALDSTEFGNGEFAENGMLFAIDRANHSLKKATAALAANHVIGINYSSEHMYDERKSGLKNFALRRGEFLPRLGYPAAGDKYTTNTVCYDSEKITDLDATLDAITTTPLYAGIASDGSGYWELTATMPTAGPVAQVVEKTTMPDGQLAVMLEIIKA